MLNNDDFVASLVKQQGYLDEIAEEMGQDDTLELLGGTRKAKPVVKQMEHIQGVSDLTAKQKAREARSKSITLSKQKHLNRCLTAVGVYVRKFIIDHLHDEGDYAVDAGPFGRFSLMQNADAGPDALYQKKIVYDPSS